MNGHKSEQASTGRNTLATNAFLLGWSVSETLGHLRKGARPSQKSARPAKDYAPRLVVSNGSVEKSGDAFVLAAQRIVQLYREFGFESGDALSPLTQAVYALPRQIRDWIDGHASSFYTQHELRELLNEWSLQVWARLDGTSAEAARAFTAGMSLADTYWYLRPPQHRPKELKEGQVSEEDWRRLLSKFRLDVERSRLKSLQSNLPPYVVPVLRKHLKQWSIGTTLGYADGKLVSQPNTKASGALDPKHETLLQQALERQVQNWEAMLFGLREATTFLRAADVRWITVGRWVGLFFALLATAIFLLIAAAVIAYFLSTQVFPFLIRVLTAQQAGVGDWLAIVNLLWSILIAVPVPLVLRAAYQATRGVQKWLDDELTIWFITRRTFVQWNRYLGKDEG